MADDSIRARSSRGPRSDATASPPMRLAQLVRPPSSTPAAAHDRAGDGLLVIELGDARLTIEPGADLTAVVTVLALLRGVAV